MTAMDRRRLLQGAAALAVTAGLVSQGVGTAAARADDVAGSPGGLPEARSLDARPFPAYDYTRASKLPR